MKTAVAVLSTLALVAAAPVVARGDAGIIHSATGAGQHPLGSPRTFEFNALERGDGTVTGQAELQSRLTGTHDTRGVHVDLDCLNVVGDLALASGTITKSLADPSDPFATGNVAIFAAEDSGEGANAAPDRITLLIAFTPEVVPPGTALCELVGPAHAEPLLMPIEGGNVVVR
jgi:hypothetical protein